MAEHPLVVKVDHGGCMDAAVRALTHGKKLDCTDLQGKGTTLSFVLRVQSAIEAENLTCQFEAVLQFWESVSVTVEEKVETEGASDESVVA